MLQFSSTSAVAERNMLFQNASAKFFVSSLIDEGRVDTKMLRHIPATGACVVWGEMC